MKDLSAREKQVIELLCQGVTKQEAADKLLISYETVKRHDARARRKLGAKNRAQMVRCFEPEAMAQLKEERDEFRRLYLELREALLKLVT